MASRGWGCAVAAALCAVGACTSGNAVHGRTDRFHVVAALYPLAAMARAIGGNAVDVTDLTPQGGEPHDLELRPNDLAALQSADLILYIQGLQPAVDDAVRSLPPRKRFNVLDALDATGPRPSADPHVWLDPLTLKAIARTFGGRLIADVSDPGGALRTATERFTNELDALDAAYRAGLSHCERREIFSSHEAFGRLALRYGLEQIALTGLAPDAEPLPERLQKIARLAREKHATTIFAEPLSGARAADVVARVTGLRVAILDPIESLTREGHASGADYFSLMRANLTALEEGLGCRAA